MRTTAFNSRQTPCNGCPDRYPACSAKCKKPEYIKYQQEQETIRKNRQEYELVTGYTAKQIQKNRRVK